ncbi:oxidoreductase [Terribacillus saccharophilus]|uniref:SDR family oxidoreductase n=1 Tax=Terribacillus saccharophilus TaxID=361277 RepID=UPI000BA4EF64|nr:SDR family oxidoreductase [Terribacillus saccharophilus]PAF17279.1 oxidoreductase [Terribacillus saccharophilus]PAF35476.1 oxidoreductase [Terribacillus saccharophilus]PAF40316.1 oxidoreductase [Terribacillus saccharophilus]
MAKIAIVTGVSYPRSIGTAVCRRLAEQGVDIFFTYWRAGETWPDQLTNEIRETGVRCKGLEADLEQPEAAETILQEVQQKLGVPSILVNCAAFSENGNYEELDRFQLDRHYAVNMRSVFLLCTGFAKLFKEHRPAEKGSIVNLTSGQSQGPMPDELAYIATKGAITSFTQSLAADLASLGINVNAVNPGPTDSTWMTDGIRQHLLPQFPMGRIGEPDDAARLISFLVGEDGYWVTGQELHSEGGFLRR